MTEANAQIIVATCVRWRPLPQSMDKFAAARAALDHCQKGYY
jgi:hypothetical protein